MLGQSRDPAAHPRKEGRLMTLETSDLRDHWTLQSHDTERQASDRQHCELALHEPSRTAAGFRARALARLLRGAAPPRPTLWAVWRLDSYLRKLWHRYSGKPVAGCPAVSEDFWWQKSEPSVSVWVTAERAVISLRFQAGVSQAICLGHFTNINLLSFFKKKELWNQNIYSKHISWTHLIIITCVTVAWKNKNGCIAIDL